MEQETIKTEVVIVGAGPTGLSLAAQLLRCGVDFVIFDKKEGTTDLSKALVVHARTMEIYDQIGLAKSVVENGEIVRRAVLLGDGAETARLDFSGFGEGLSPFPFFLTFEQSKNERLLYDYLKAGGKDVLWQTELEDFAQTESGIAVRAKSADGAAFNIQGKYIVGCDGASSKTRHLLNLEFSGSTYARLFYVADVEMEFEAEAATVYATFGTDATVLLFPMLGAKRWRIIGNLPEYDREEKPEIAYEAIEEKIKREVQRPLDITKVNWFSTYKVHTRHVERFSKNRAFLAGDAAHVHTPTGGQGMNTGIQDAYNLAWKLAFVLKNDAAESLLDTYNEERLPNAKRLVETTDEAFDIVVGSHWYQRFLRDALVPLAARIVTRFDAAKDFLFPMISQIGINYRDSSLSLHAADKDFDVKAGDRMPYFLVEGANIFDSLRAPKFHFIVFSDGKEIYNNLKSEIENKLSDSVDFTIVPLYPHVTEIFGINKSFGVLLRPDNYIGQINEKISTDLIVDYLRNVYELKANSPVKK